MLTDLFCRHEWMSIGRRGHRTCPKCCRVEDASKKRVPGTDAYNWAGVVRRISLDGCDSLREHREMLASQRED